MKLGKDTFFVNLALASVIGLLAFAHEAEYPMAVLVFCSAFITITLASAVYK